MGKRRPNALGWLAFTLVAVIIFFLGWVASKEASALVNGQVAGTVVIDGKVYVVISEQDARALVEVIEETRAQRDKLWEMLRKGGCV